MDLMKMATQLFLDKVGAGGMNEDTVTNALSGLLGDGAGNIDIGSILSKVNGSGLADIAKSWLGDGANGGIDAQQIMSMFGESEVGNFASKLNIDPATASGGLAGMLPELIDKNSSGGNLLDAVGGGGGILGMASKLFK